MNRFPWRCLSIVITGDDLHAVGVRGGPLGGRARGPVTLAGFLSMDSDRARSELEAIDPGGEIVLTCPAAWTAVRSIAVPPGRWEAARNELRRSVDQLLPLDPADAEIGLITKGETDGGEGWLVGVRGSVLAPWLEAIERAMGRRVGRVLSTHMAMPGLGIQHDPSAVIIERISSFLPASVHHFEYGRPAELAEPERDADDTDRSEDERGARRLIVDPMDAGEGEARWAEVVQAGDLALGAALADRVCPGVSRPIRGGSPSRARRWMAPALATAAGLVLLIGTIPLHHHRLADATSELRSEAAMLETSVREAEALRSDAESSIELLREAVIAPTEDWTPVLPVLAEVHRALGDDGFFQRVEVTPEDVVIRGQAPSATAVQERLELSDRLVSVRPVAPITRSRATGLDIFEFRASRRVPGEEAVR